VFSSDDRCASALEKHQDACFLQVTGARRLWKHDFFVTTIAGSTTIDDQDARFLDVTGTRRLWKIIEKRVFFR
jgi:hypothetical protein